MLKKILAVFSLLTFYFLFVSNVFAQSSSDWYMAGGNPQRTSWVNADISGVMGIEWYRPIEAYIDQKTQIVATNGNIYIATAKGMIVLNAQTGDLVWRFDTEMPLGHTPTVVGNSLYIGGYDRKLYALNALTGQLLPGWPFTGAKAGYSVSPLVVNNTVYVGNRDGYFYAVDATNGTLRWQFPGSNQDSLGPIMDSASYSSSQNAVYFAANNMRGYALNATTGQPIWFHTENGQQVAGTEKLPGMGVQSFWSVVDHDRVIFSTIHPFMDGSPGYSSLPGVGSLERFRDVVFGVVTEPNVVRYSGDRLTADAASGWNVGTPLIDTTSNVNYPSGTYNPTPISIQQYFADRPSWRTTVAVSANSGQILTGNDNPPFTWSGTTNGSRVPPVVDPATGVVYNSDAYSKSGSNIARQKIMGWLPGNKYISNRFGADYAIDEPAILSGAGSDIMMNLCCDRIAVMLTRNRYFWNYGSMLDAILPSQNTNGQFTPNVADRYDPMWGLADSNLERLTNYYKGTTTTPNGIYSNHGLQNPLVPYRFTNGQGQTIQRLFTHRSNTIIALGPGNSKQNLTPITIDSTLDSSASSLSESELINRLERYLDKMISAREQDPNRRFLNPGYYYSTQGQREYVYTAPAETLETLSEAYQLLQNRGGNPTLRSRLQTYIQDYYSQYLSSSNIGNTGWQGMPREDIAFTPELLTDMADNVPSGAGFTVRDVYGLWKYVETFPSNPPTALALSVYNRVKNSVPTIIPPSTTFTDVADWNLKRPWEVNNYVAGYYGLLHLQYTAGFTTSFCDENPGNAECQKRSQVQTALNTLLAEKSQHFRKDQPIYGAWDNPTGITGMSNNFKVLNFSRNFLYMVPELGAYFAANIRSQIQTAVNEYTYLGPFWFASRVDSDKQERVMHNLYDIPSIFSAKAWILGATQSELSKYIDVPAFPRGDLYYIQNLVSTLEAPLSGTEPTNPPTTPSSTPIPGDANNDGKVDGIDYIIWLNHYNQNVGGISNGDFDNNGKVDGVDYVIWLNHYMG